MWIKKASLLCLFNAIFSFFKVSGCYCSKVGNRAVAEIPVRQSGAKRLNFDGKVSHSHGRPYHTTAMEYLVFVNHPLIPVSPPEECLVSSSSLPLPRILTPIVPHPCEDSSSYFFLFLPLNPLCCQWQSENWVYRLLLKFWLKYMQGGCDWRSMCQRNMSGIQIQYNLDQHLYCGWRWHCGSFFNFKRLSFWRLSLPQHGWSLIETCFIHNKAQGCLELEVVAR